jgi:hypothetical protein
MSESSVSFSILNNYLVKKPGPDSEITSNFLASVSASFSLGINDGSKEDNCVKSSNYFFFFEDSALKDKPS